MSIPTFRQIDRLHASFERKLLGAEAMLGIDAVAIKFAGSACRDDEVGISHDDQPERVVGSAIRGMEFEQARNALRPVVGRQNLRADATIRDRHAERRRSTASTLTISREVRGPQLAARPASS